MASQRMHIGLDDTDSIRKGCTTYVAALLVEKLLGLGAKFVDYPNLIRLNPNVPWKTRGNGALCLRIECDDSLGGEIKETVLSTVEEQADLDSRDTDPGIVFFTGKRVPEEIHIFAETAISGIAHLDDALRLLAKFKAEAIGFKNGRGIIGSLAAVGENLEGDHTYEIIAYRVQENYGSRRKVTDASVFEMDRATAPYTFNNVDVERRRVIITPRGPDPILFGIRGESPETLKKAFEMLEYHEPVERWIIFRTNQGTDAHLKPAGSLRQIKKYQSVIAQGVLSSNPRIVPLRHVIFSIGDGNAKLDCAAYEPTGNLRRAARELIIGDQVEVCGGIRTPSQDRPLTINLEKIRVLDLLPRITYSNPICSNCGRRLKSMGRGKGFRCEKCHSRYPKLLKTEIRVKREIQTGLYIAATRSQRHLTKPFRRYGLEKSPQPAVSLVNGWHFP